MEEIEEKLVKIDPKQIAEVLLRHLPHRYTLQDCMKMAGDIVKLQKGDG